MRFLASIGGAEAPLPTPWRRLHAGNGWSLWSPDQRVDGGPLEDGFWLGAVAMPPRNFRALAATWGGCIGFADESEALRIYRDPSGKLPAYLVQGRHSRILCSDLGDAFPALGSRAQFDWLYLTALLLGDVTPARRTGFVEVREVLPGESIIVSAHGVASQALWEPRTYWREPFRSVVQAKAALRSAAEAGVDFWGRRYARVTVDLSGGLDSSSVLGLLAGLERGPRITAVNARVGHPESDERRFARLAAEAARVELVEIDLGDELPSYADGVRQPLQPRPTPQLRRLGLDLAALPIAKTLDAEAYVTGRGGDHLFYDHVPTLAARDLLASWPAPTRFLAGALDLARSSGQPFASVVRDALAPAPNSRDLSDMVLRGNPLVTRQAAAAIRVEDVVHPWVQDAAQSAPLGKIRQIHYLAELQRHYDRTDRAAILDEVHPLMSQPVIEASLRTPSWMFSNGGVRRGLQRQIFADVVPSEILARRTKGATTSRSTRVLVRNLPYLRERLLDGPLVQNGILDGAALEEALTPAAVMGGKLRAHLMDCVMVQLWLDQAGEALAGGCSLQTAD